MIEGQRHPETDLRLIELQRMMLAGKSVLDLRLHCCEQWQLSERSARRLIAAARQEIKEDFSLIERPTMIAVLLARLDRLIEQAEADRNWNACVGAIRTQCKLAGLIRGE